MDDRAMMKLCATLLLSDNIPFPEKSTALAENPILFKCAAVLLLAGVLLSCHSTCVQLFINTILSVKLLTTDGVCDSCWALSVADTNINTSEKNVL